MDQDHIDSIVWDGPPQMTRARLSRLFGFQYITQNVITSKKVQRILNETVAREFGDEADWDVECGCTLQNGRTRKCHEGGCLNREDYRECAATCGEGCENQPFRNNQWKSKLKVEHRHGRGLALVTMEGIREDEFVLEFTGSVYVKTENPLYRTTVYALDISRTIGKNRLVIEPTTAGNLSRFLSHSDNPNCNVYTYFAGGTLHNVVVANKSVSPGTELSFDYGSLKEQLGIKECLCEYEGCENFQNIVSQLEKSARKMFINTRLPTCQHSNHLDETSSTINEPINEQQPGTSRVVCPEFYEHGRDGRVTKKSKPGTSGGRFGQEKRQSPCKERTVNKQKDKATNVDSSSDDLFEPVITYRKKVKAHRTKSKPKPASKTSLTRNAGKGKKNDGPPKETNTAIEDSSDEDLFVPITYTKKKKATGTGSRKGNKNKTPSEASSSDDLFIPVIKYRKKEKSGAASSQASLNRKGNCIDKPKRSAGGQSKQHIAERLCPEAPPTKYQKRDDGTKTASASNAKKGTQHRAPVKTKAKPRLVISIRRLRPSTVALWSAPKKPSPKGMTTRSMKKRTERPTHASSRHGDLTEITRYQCRGCLRNFDNDGDAKTHQIGKSKECLDKGFRKVKQDNPNHPKPPKDQESSSDEDQNPSHD